MKLINPFDDIYNYNRYLNGRMYKIADLSIQFIDMEHKITRESFALNLHGDFIYATTTVKDSKIDRADCAIYD